MMNIYTGGQNIYKHEIIVKTYEIYFNKNMKHKNKQIKTLNKK